MTATTLIRTRRRSELALGLLVVVVTGGGYILVALSDGPELPADLWAFLASVLGLYVVAHLAIRRLAPGADATLLPLAAVLNGIGFVTISRLDRDLARIQAGWVAVGVVAFVVTLLVVRNTRLLEKYRYTFALLGVGFLLLPLLPGIGRTINGARLWVSIGPLNFQPGEIAKVLLVIFFAAYLADNRELLAAGQRAHRPHLRARRCGTSDRSLLAWGFSILVMVYEKDLGSSLLFFGVFAAMLYMATGRGYYLFVGLILFLIGAALAYAAFGHVQVRVDTWINPWRDPTHTGFQIIQSWYAFGTGGFAGTGLGLGNPDKIPNAATDFVYSAIGEELGLLGTVGVLIAFMLFVGSAYRIAVDAVRPFAKLFAAGHRDDHRLPDRDHPRRRHARDPAHRYHVAVRVVRWFFTRRELRARSRCCCASRTRPHAHALLRRKLNPSARHVNATIRRVGIGMLVLFLGLVAQPTYLQIVRADDLKNDPNNVRVFLRDYSRPRGLILSADRTILAQSLPTTGDLKQIRVYPPETASCSRTSSGTRPSTSATPASRPSTTTRSSAATSTSRSTTSATSSVARTHTATSCSRWSRRPRRPRPTRSRAGAARWSSSTWRRAASSPRTRTRRSIRTSSRATTPRPRARTSRRSTPIRRSPRSPARGARSSRPAPRSRS